MQIEIKNIALNIDVGDKKKKALVVDDESLIRLTLAAVLEYEGFQVSTTDSEDDAMARMRRTPFDLVVTDIMLTNARQKEGLTLAQRIRTEWPRTKVIAMTGCDADRLRPEAQKSGALWLCEKPFDVFVFAERARELFADSESMNVSRCQYSL